jgi:hypothetical protein
VKRDRLVLIVLAAIGASLLLVVAVNRWGAPADEHAYWLAGQRLLAGQPLYDPTATSITPFAFWYPPIVAQVMAPISVILPSWVFSAAWTVLMLVCVWWIAGRDVLVALALCAFPPVAVEFWSRNVHLIIAALLVLAIRRWGGWFAIGAAIKLAPGIGIVYLALRRRWRETGVALGVGVVLLAISVALSPDAWRQFADVMLARGPDDASTLLPIPYYARAIAGLILVVVAASIPPKWGEPLLVIGVVVALPTLWFTALSTLIAVVPLIRRPATAHPL